MSNEKYLYTKLGKLVEVSDSLVGKAQSDWKTTDPNSDSFIKNKPDLKTVATSGDYNDLINKLEAGENIKINKEWVKATDGVTNVNYFDVNVGRDKNNEEMFMAVGRDETIIVSNDAKSWKEVNNKKDGFILNKCVYGNGLWIAVGKEKTTTKAVILERYNYENSWTEKDVPIGSKTLFDVAYINNNFIAVGDGSTILVRDSNKKWTTTNNGVDQGVAFHGIAFFCENKKYFIAGYDASGKGYLYSSDNLAKWSIEKTFLGVSSIFGLAYGKKKLIAVGKTTTPSKGLILEIGEEPQHIQTEYDNPNCINGVFYIDDEFVLLGNNGCIIKNKGEGWESYKTKFEGNFWGLASSTNTKIIAGLNKSEDIILREANIIDVGEKLIAGEGLQLSDDKCTISVDFTKFSKIAKTGEYTDIKNTPAPLLSGEGVLIDEATHKLNLDMTKFKKVATSGDYNDLDNKLKAGDGISIDGQTNTISLTGGSSKIFRFTAKKYDYEPIFGGLSTARAYLSSVAVGDYALFFGGFDTKASDVIDIYKVGDNTTEKIETEKIKTDKKLLTPRAYSSAVAVGNHILVVGGVDVDGNTLNTIEYFKFENGALSEPTFCDFPLKNSRYDMQSGVVGNLVFFAGGRTVFNSNNNDEIVADVDVYRISESGNVEQIQNALTLETNRCMFSSAVIGNYILFGGGYNIQEGKQNFLNTVEVYKVDGDTITKGDNLTLEKITSNITAASFGKFVFFAGNSSDEGAAVEAFELITEVGTDSFKTIENGIHINENPLYIRAISGDDYAIIAYTNNGYRYDGELESETIRIYYDYNGGNERKIFESHSGELMIGRKEFTAVKIKDNIICAGGMDDSTPIKYVDHLVCRNNLESEVEYRATQRISVPGVSENDVGVCGIEFSSTDSEKTSEEYESWFWVTEIICEEDEVVLNCFFREIPKTDLNIVMKV